MFLTNKSIMKRVLALLCVFVLCTAFQCEDEPLEGEFITEEVAACQEATLNTAEAALAFLDTSDVNFTQICIAYKEALEAQIGVCGDEDGSIQALIEELGDCTQESDDQACVDAVTAKNEAEVAFNDTTDENYTETCNAFKEAIQLVIDECGSTAELQSELDGLGDCIQTSNEVTGEITVTAGTLDIVFDVISVVEDETLLKITGETSAANNYEIYFEIEKDTTGDDLINSEFVITFISEYFPSDESMQPFSSNITVNANTILEGTFNGLTRSTQNADLNLTSGVIDIDY